MSDEMGFDQVDIEKEMSEWGDLLDRVDDLDTLGGQERYVGEEEAPGVAAEFLDEVVEPFLNGVVSNATNQYAKLSPNGKNPAQNAMRSVNRIGKYLVGNRPGNQPDNRWNDYPNLTEDEAQALFTPEGKQAYKEKVLSYFKEKAKTMSYMDIKNAEKAFQKGIEHNHKVATVETECKKMEQLIDSEEYTWQEKQMLLRNTERRMHGGAIPGNIPETEGRFGSQESAKRWIGRVVSTVTERANGADYDKMVKGFASLNEDVGKDIELLPTQRKILGLEEQADILRKDKSPEAKRLLNVYDSVKLHMEGGVLTSKQLETATNKLISETDYACKGIVVEQIDKKFKPETLGAMLGFFEIVNPEMAAAYREEYQLVNSPDGYDLGGKGFATRATGKLQELKNAVLDADPFYMKSSPEFRNLRKTVEQGFAMADTALKNATRRNTPVTGADVEALLDQADQMESAGIAYSQYKAEALIGRAANATEQKRMKVAATAVQTAQDIRKAARVYTLDSIKNLKPDEQLNHVGQQIVDRARRKNEFTKEAVAELMYLNMAKEKFANDPKKYDANSVLSYEATQKGIKAIMENPVFDKVMENTTLKASVMHDLTLENVQKMIKGTFLQEGQKVQMQQKQQEAQSAQPKQMGISQPENQPKVPGM